MICQTSLAQKQDVLSLVQSQFVGKWQVDYAKVKKSGKPKLAGNYFFEVTSVQIDNPKWKDRHLKFEGIIFTKPIENGRIEFSDDKVAFAFTQTTIKDTEGNIINRVVHYSGVIEEDGLMFLAFEPGNEDRKLFRWYGKRVTE
jgi:hypothetical protein